MNRNQITSPDGRSFSGRWAQDMPPTGEGPYIAALARTVGGACEVVLPVGRADVATNETVFEVEPASQWRIGARQALSYAGQSGLAPALALFGPADYLPIYLFIRNRLPGMTLWIFRNQWQRTTSRADAKRVFHPSHVPAA